MVVNLKSSRKKVMRMKDLVYENKQKKQKSRQLRSLRLGSCEEILWKYFRESSTCDIKCEKDTFVTCDTWLSGD